MKVLQTSALPLGYDATWLLGDLNSCYRRERAVSWPLDQGAITPRVGLEPTTARLTAACSTDWAIEEYTSKLRALKTAHIISYFYIILQHLLDIFWNGHLMDLRSFRCVWSSSRPISSSQLHASLHFHLCPIYLVVFKGSYFFRMGYLILRGASRLDAFSVYPFRTWLPCHAAGTATGTPAVRPSRSSRTKDSSSQISYAHAG